MTAMITREMDYAIRAMVFLAGDESGHVQSTDLLARELDIPYQFLRRIVLKLTAAGLLKSCRGKGGGISLAKAANRISLLETMSAIDPGSAAINDCSMNPQFCRRSGYCAVHEELGKVQVVLNRKLSGIALASLAKKNKQHNRST